MTVILDRCFACLFRMAQSSFNRVLNLLARVRAAIDIARSFAEFAQCFSDQCQMTVMGGIILRFSYKVWFFGAVYFCLSWLFLVVSPRPLHPARAVHIVFLDLRRRFLFETVSTPGVEYSRIHRGTSSRRWRRRWCRWSINTVKTNSPRNLAPDAALSFSFSFSFLDLIVSDEYCTLHAYVCLFSARSFSQYSRRKPRNHIWCSCFVSTLNL